jgi:hypothetical protein
VTTQGHPYRRGKDVGGVVRSGAATQGRPYMGSSRGIGALPGGRMPATDPPVLGGAGGSG